MQKKDIIIIILVVLLLVSSGAAVYFSQRVPKMLLGQQAEKEICDILPLYTGSESSGLDASPYIARDICRLVFAVEKQDSEICKGGKTKEFSGACYAAVAVKTGDIKVCDSASGDVRDKCYSEAARQIGDMASCEKISNINEKDNCFASYAGSKNDAAACVKIQNESQRDGCYMSQAFRDPSLCEKIVNSQMKTDCQRNTAR